MSDTTQQAALRADLGAQFANIAFNWAQKPGYTLSERDCAMLKGLQVQWDSDRSAAPDSAPVAWIDPKELAATQEVMNGYCSGIVWNKKVGTRYLPLYLATPADKGDVGLLEASVELAAFARTAPGRLPQHVQDALSRVDEATLRQRLEGKE